MLSAQGFKRSHKNQAFVIPSKFLKVSSMAFGEDNEVKRPSTSLRFSTPPILSLGLFAGYSSQKLDLATTLILKDIKNDF